MEFLDNWDYDPDYPLGTTPEDKDLNEQHKPVDPDDWADTDYDGGF